jgi:hypothetical protein
MSSLAEKGAIPPEDADGKLFELAKLIAPLSQDVAKIVIEAVKAGEPPERLSRQYARFKHVKAGWRGSSRSRKSAAKPG